MKQAHKEQAKELYDDQGLERPFGKASKGLGRKYLAENLDYIRENGGYYVRGKIRPIPQYYKDLIQQEPQNQAEKVENWRRKAQHAKENDINEWRRATGLLKEKHLIIGARQKGQPIDDYFLENYKKPSEYKALIKEIEDFEKEYLCN